MFFTTSKCECPSHFFKARSQKIELEKCEVFVQKLLSSKKRYFERNNSQTSFCSLCVNLPTVKIWWQSDKYPMSLALYSVRFKWESWFEKTALNMSIRWVIFTSGEKLNTAISLPIFNVFLWFFVSFFCFCFCFYIRDFMWIIIWRKSSIWR